MAKHDHCRMRPTLVLQITLWGGLCSTDERPSLFCNYTTIQLEFFVVRMLLGVGAIHDYTSLAIVAHASSTIHNGQVIIIRQTLRVTHLLQTVA
jgi:hypothetical protein